MDIGGGTTEVAVISLSAIAYAESVRVAGDELNETIQRFIQDEFQILIGENLAEQIKITIGSAMAANWKMFKLRGEAGATAAGLVSRLSGKLPADREVLVIPPFTALWAVGEALAGVPGFALGAQNFYPSKQGAFTGEIAPDMVVLMVK